MTHRAGGLDDPPALLYDCPRLQFRVVPPQLGGAAMAWEAPDFVEVKMDAEINSYQDDFGGEQDDRF
jgi:hypothetical protein